MTRHSYFEDYFFLKSFIARAVTNRLSSFHRTSLSVGLLSFRSGLWTTMGQGNVSRLKDIVGDEHFCHYVILSEFLSHFRHLKKQGGEMEEDCLTDKKCPPDLAFSCWQDQYNTCYSLGHNIGPTSPAPEGKVVCVVCIGLFTNFFRSDKVQML